MKENIKGIHSQEGREKHLQGLNTTFNESVTYNMIISDLKIEKTN